RLRWVLRRPLGRPAGVHRRAVDSHVAPASAARQLRHRRYRVPCNSAAPAGPGPPPVASLLVQTRQSAARASPNGAGRVRRAIAARLRLSRGAAASAWLFVVSMLAAALGVAALGEP